MDAPFTDDFTFNPRNDRETQASNINKIAAAASRLRDMEYTRFTTEYVLNLTLSTVGTYQVWVT